MRWPKKHLTHWTMLRFKPVINSSITTLFNAGTRDTWRHTKRYKRRDFNQHAGCQETQGTRPATSKHTGWCRGRVTEVAEARKLSHTLFHVDANALIGTLADTLAKRSTGWHTRWCASQSITQQAAWHAFRPNYWLTLYLGALRHTRRCGNGLVDN